MTALLAVLALLAPAPQPGSSGDLIAFAQTARRPGNLLLRSGIAGYSVQNRPIRLVQYGDPKWSGELLVFGCIHGDECAAAGLEPLSALTAYCPDPASDVFVVPNLDPDGAAAGSRLNALGVDLNRNFDSRWRSIGRPGDAEYSGPRPFSEPETRLAARIVHALEPRRRSGSTSTGGGGRSSAPGARASPPLATSRRWRECPSGRCTGRRGRRRTGRTTTSPRRPSSSSCRRGGWRRRCGVG